jgi:hypothetical protein
MSGSISGLLGLLDQAQQQPNAVGAGPSGQQPPVAGLLGNATQLLPTDPFAAQRAAQAAQPQAPAAPPYQTPRAATDAWAAQMNQNAYGKDPAMQGLAGSAGFPLWSDPRMVQDHLAQLAQGTISTPGVDPQDAQDELMRRIRGGGWGGPGGGYGGGEGGGTSGGGSGGQGQDASGQW